MLMFYVKYPSTVSFFDFLIVNSDCHPSKIIQHTAWAETKSLAKFSIAAQGAWWIQLHKAQSQSQKPRVCTTLALQEMSDRYRYHGNTEPERMETSWNIINKCR